MKSVFAFILLGSLLIACGKKSGPVTAAKYHCPMHPTVVSDKPGDCPICGMKLVPTNDEEHAAQSSGKNKTMYRSTMNPNEVSDHPGKDSMGMDMVAFEVAEGAEQSTVPGLAAVSITPAAQERMGLTFGKVEKRLLAREVRTSARIVADETKLYRVTVKIEGWVEKLFVATTGQHVEKGEPLLTIYSPDLVAAQREFLIAQKSGSTELLAAVRRRLKLWDITDEQVAKLEAAGEGEKVLTLYAPASGFVQEKMVVAGQKIMPGESLMTVADLSTVWADADIYQSDLPYLKIGMSAEVNVADKKFTGQVIFISPTLDPMTRTAKARLEIPNPELLLKPEMYGTAKLSYELGERLAIPETAVMRTGERTYAFKSGGDHQIVPVQINTGGRSDGWVEVIDGLSEGDQVVTSANFLVDSESSMKAALAGMSGGHQH
jgi:membrane fusion protein, copper/silver efflux system